MVWMVQLVQLGVLEHLVDVGYLDYLVLQAGKVSRGNQVLNEVEMVYQESKVPLDYLAFKEHPVIQAFLDLLAGPV